MDSFIQSLVGKPYEVNSYSGHSFDCYSLIHYIYAHYGIIIPKRITSHAIHNLQREIKHDIKAQLWREVSFKDKKFLDVLLFTTVGRLNTHVGMVVDSKFFIHAVENVSVCLGHLASDLNLARLYKVYRWHTL